MGLRRGDLSVRESAGVTQSCRKTLSSELLILSGRSPLYSMEAELRELVEEEVHARSRGPDISASVSCETFGTTRTGRP